MVWINERAFFERQLRNELVSLTHLKVAVERMNLVAVDRGHPTVATDDIDEAIKATLELLKSGSHHA